MADARLTLTPELAATIRGARLVGTPLRACAKAAGVPWDTMIGWLRVGRAYNAAEPAKRNPRHVAQAAFAAELDRAGAQCESALHARVMKATEDDGRLALDVLRSAPADSAPWARAVAVLEGGPLRMRHAVELAGLVVDATEHGVTGEEMTG